MANVAKAFGSAEKDLFAKKDIIVVNSVCKKQYIVIISNKIPPVWLLIFLFRFSCFTTCICLKQF